jgi:hypothetical protein
MRTSVTYANGGHRSHAPPKALSPGRPEPAPPPPEAPPDPARQWRPPDPPRRPLVTIIQEVINRSAPSDLRPGTRVVVRNRFNGRWTPGFSVHEVLDAGYRIRRDHTGAVLPAVFFSRDVAAHESTRNVGWERADRAGAHASL